MPLPIGGDSRASEELSALTESLLNEPDIEDSLYAEIEALVGEFGEEERRT